jgi:hypothetical protein
VEKSFFEKFGKGEGRISPVAICDCIQEQHRNIGRRPYDFTEQEAIIMLTVETLFFLAGFPADPS